MSGFYDLFGGGNISTFDEGVLLTAGTTSFNFTGAGVTATNIGGAVTIDIPGGGSISGADTQVLFFDGANNPAGEAGLTYNKTTDSLTMAGTMSSASANISGLTASKVVFTDASKNLTSTGIGNSTDFIKGDGSLDSSTYLTGNQTIALSGDVSGTGSTSITTTIGAGVVGIAMLSATGTPSATTFLRGDNTWATPAGSGTVTNTGTLTSNAVVLGNGSADVKVVAGITTNGAGQLVLGVNATTLGNVKMFGSTSGDVTFGPAAVAGTATVFTLPATNGTSGYFLQTNGSGITSWAASSGGLTNWTEGVTTAAPNATVPAVDFTVTNAATNVDAVIKAKGTGATIAQIPDNTATGGDKRGIYSTDWGKIRASSDQVASGAYSTIGGGERNKVVGSWSTVAGGYNNRAASASSVVAGGESNNISAGSAAVIGGGSSNSSTQDYTFIGGGLTNGVTGAYGSCIGGDLNSASGTRSLVSGSNSIASGSYSSAFGLWAESYLYGMYSNASGRFGAIGDAQSNQIIYRRSITGTTITELFLDGASVQAILKSGNTIWNATISVVATVQTVGNGTVTLGDSYVSNHLVGIKRIGSATSLIGAVQLVGAVQNDAGMAGASVTITADNTNEALKIEFTPPTLAGTTTVCRAVAVVQLAELRY